MITFLFLLAADDLLLQGLGQARYGEKRKEREKEGGRERERERFLAPYKISQEDKICILYNLEANLFKFSKNGLRGRILILLSLFYILRMLEKRVLTFPHSCSYPTPYPSSSNPPPPPSTSFPRLSTAFIVNGFQAAKWNMQKSI